MRLTKDKTVRCKRRKEKLLHFCLRPVINNRDLSRIEGILAPNIPYRKGNKTVQFATYNRFITSHKLLQYIGSFHKSCCFRSTILIVLIIENHTRWNQNWNMPSSNSGPNISINQRNSTQWEDLLFSWTFYLPVMVSSLYMLDESVH